MSNGESFLWARSSSSSIQPRFGRLLLGRGVCVGRVLRRITRLDREEPETTQHAIVHHARCFRDGHLGSDLAQALVHPIFFLIAQTRCLE